MPTDFTTALGRLLADADLRAEFRREPALTAGRLDLSEADRKALRKRKAAVA